jgi:hypothetical protein
MLCLGPASRGACELALEVGLAAGSYHISQHAAAPMPPQSACFAKEAPQRPGSGG